LFGTTQHPTDHHRGGASDDGLGQVTAKADAAVGDQRYASTFQGSSHIGHGADRRYADGGNDAGGADPGRADSDLDAISARLGQSLGCLAGGDVAADYLNFRKVLLDPSHAVDHALGVTVRGIDDDHVNTGGDQCGNAVAGIGTGADGRADAQTAMLVLAGQRVGLGLLDVVDGHHALEAVLVIDDQYALDAVLVQQLAHGVLVFAFLDGDQTLLRRHDFTHLGVHTAFEAHVAGGDDAHQITMVQHRHAGNVVLAGDVEQVTDSRISLDGDRILHHAGLEALDLAHLGSLLLDGHVLVDDANAAFLSHGDGQTRLGDRVHGSGQQRNVQFDAAGQAGLQADILGQYLGITGNEQDVVESECFLADAQHGRAPERENKKRGIIPSDLAALNAKLSSNAAFRPDRRPAPASEQSPDVRRTPRRTPGAIRPPPTR